jgi:hypothetical protein
LWDFDFEVFDSAGVPVERTELGRQAADILRNWPPKFVTSFSRNQLAPLQQTVYPVNLSSLASYFLAQNWFFANGNPFGDSVGKRQKARRSSHRALKILILGNFVFSVV